MIIKKEVLGWLLAAVGRSARVWCVIFLSPIEVIVIIKKEVLGWLLAAVGRSARVWCDFLSPRVRERKTTRKLVVILKERRRTASVHQ